MSVWATAQRGLITRDQLRRLGATEDAIAGWLRAGWLRRQHESVFAVGHLALPPGGQALAAVLAGGEGAALSHVAAAIHLRLLDWTPAEIDVMVPRSGERDRDGIRFHRPRIYDPVLDVRDVDGIPCTTPGRTLVDLAGTVPFRALERAVLRAEYLDLLDLREVAGVLARISRPRGVRNLRRCLGPDRLDAARADSGLERAYLQLVVEAGLERPLLQAPFVLGPEETIRVDFFWPRQRLIVEVDGPHHARPVRMAADQRRDAALEARGFRVVRFTDPEVHERPEHVVARTRTLLSASRDD